MVHQLRFGEALDRFGDGSVARAAHPLFGGECVPAIPAPNRESKPLGEPEDRHVGAGARRPLVLTIAEEVAAGLQAKKARRRPADRIAPGGDAPVGRSAGVARGMLIERLQNVVDEAFLLGLQSHVVFSGVRRCARTRPEGASESCGEQVAVKIDSQGP